MAREAFEIVERGHGVPLVLIPGVQGRWEYSRGIVEALARFYRVITFSLCDERTWSGGNGCQMDVFAGQVEAALDRLQVGRAIIADMITSAAARVGRVAANRNATRPPNDTPTMAALPMCSRFSAASTWSANTSR